MSTWIGPFIRASAVALVAALTSASLYAQPGAALRGRVVDPLGAVVAGATIRVRGDLGFDRSTTTDGEGRYQIAAIPPTSGSIPRCSSPSIGSARWDATR